MIKVKALTKFSDMVLGRTVYEGDVWEVSLERLQELIEKENEMGMKAIEILYIDKINDGKEKTI